MCRCIDHVFYFPCDNSSIIELKKDPQLRCEQHALGRKAAVHDATGMEERHNVEQLQDEEAFAQVCG